MTKTDVANLALAKLGDKRITNLDNPNDENARVAKLHYRQALDEVLREAFWSFAIVSVALVAEDEGDVTAAELLGWSFALALPADFLKLKELQGDRGKIDRFELRRANGKRCLLCNSEEPTLIYVARIDTPDEYDPLFTAALISLLASKMARAISGSDQLETTLLQRYETVDLPKARLADGHDSQSNENHPLDEMLAGSLTGTRGGAFCDPLNDYGE